MKEVRFISEPVEMEYTRSPGKILGHFFAKLRDDGIILGIRCSHCSEIFVPPQQYCPECTHKMMNFVNIPQIGSISSFTTVKKDSPFVSLKAPYSYISIKFEGVKSNLWHLYKETSEIKIGDRVKPVFKSKEEREGSILDIKYFEKVS